MLRKVGLVVIVITCCCFLLFSATFYSGTIYSSGYSERKFAEIKVGMSLDEVKIILGPPLTVEANRLPHISWYFGVDNDQVDEDGGLQVGSPVTTIATDNNGVVTGLSGSFISVNESDWIGRTIDDFMAVYGKTSVVRDFSSARYLVYSRPGESGWYYLRRIGIDEFGKVRQKLQWFVSD